MLSHAQIGGLEESLFVANNVTATEMVLAAARRKGQPYVVHLSSSVVESVVEDHYTRTKERQEELVRDSGLPCCVLRPTLMFGWFDRKHIGWLARFMRRTPIFPIPGNGRYMRQPLYFRRLLRHRDRLHRAATIRRSAQHLGAREDRLHRPHSGA